MFFVEISVFMGSPELKSVRYFTKLISVCMFVCWHAALERILIDRIPPNLKKKHNNETIKGALRLKHTIASMVSEASRPSRSQGNKAVGQAEVQYPFDLF